MGMSSGSWASYQSALPIEARAGGEPDHDEPRPGRHDHEPPAFVYVEWFQPVTWTEEVRFYDIEADAYRKESIEMTQDVPHSRWFPAERWAWKHAEAWRAAMAKRWGHARIEEVF